eukprot:5166458-Ditylum_brightwellii.AAC.1
MESHIWIVSLPGRGIQYVSSEDLQDMSRFYIVPPGADVVLQKNKKQSWLEQHKRRKEEHVSNVEARQLADVE